MLQVINYLRLSRTDSDEISVIEAKQGDNQGDICQIEIYDNQDIVDLSQFDDILFTANKPDHSSVLFRLSDGKNLIKNNNTLSLTLTSVLLSVHGTVECEISLYNDDIIKSTYNFNIYVFKSPSSFDVMNDSDITTIKNAVSNIISSTLKAQESEKNAKQSEINSKKSEDSASVSANLASSKASEASSSATAAKTSETNSKVSEIASAKSENNALNYANQASASKNAAKTSETNAKKSETNAAVSEKNATNKATEASNSATLSKSYAVGGTGTRTNEDTDNAKYYKEQTSISEKNSSTSAANAKESEKKALSSANIATDKASQAATSEENAANSANSASASATTASTKATEASNSAKSAATSATSASNSATSAKNYADSWKGSLLPQGDITFSQLPTSGMIKGYMYCITEYFTTDSRFEEGSGFFYPADTCVYWTENNQWKCLSGVLSRKISQAEYDSLTDAQKNNGTIYYIEDGDNLLKEATITTNGLMSANDKNKLDNVQTGAEVNQNAFSNVVVGSTTISADSKTDSLTLAGNNVTITPDADNDKVIIGITKSNVTSALGYTPLNQSLKGSASGLAELDSNGKVPSSQLPSFVDDVVEGYLSGGKFYKESAHTTEISGETGKIYIDLSTEKTYRWSGSAFVVISETLALGETSSTAYRGDRGKTAYDHSQSTHARTDATKVEKSSTNGNIKINGTETNVYTHPSGTNPHGTTKSDVGLGNVGNFKAVSTVANQGLSDTEKSNARANIGAGTSSFSGSYNDLSNKPTIPTVGNGTVTIKQAGTSKGTFTMNQSGNTTIELTDNNTTYGVATSSVLGLVKSGTDITVDSSGNVSINDDSHNHVISNVDGLQNVLDGKSVNKTLTNENLNNVTTPGFYNAGGSNTVTNKPSGINHFGLIVIHRALGAYYTQIIFNDTSSYRRFCTDDTWGSWVQDKLTDTHYTSHLYVGASGGNSNATSTTSNPYLLCVDNTTNRNSIQLKAGSNMSISAVNGVVTFSATDTNTTYSAATTSTAGLMSASDKSKLDGIASGANAYSLPTASSSTLGGVKTTSTVTSSSGYTACPIISGVPYYKDTNTTYSLATQSANGLLSASDKKKLDGIASGANAYSLPTASSSTLGGVKTTSTVTSSSGYTACPIISGVPYYKDTNTTYSLATQSANGLLSASDKKKLDGIASGANAYSLPTASSSTLGGVKTTSTVTSSSGYTACPIISGVPYYKDTNTTYSLATQSANGLLSASDKKKLDGITSGANAKFISLTQTEYDNLKTKESNVIYFITDAD